MQASDECTPRNLIACINEVSNKTEPETGMLLCEYSMLLYFNLPFIENTNIIYVTSMIKQLNSMPPEQLVAKNTLKIE